MSVTVQSARFVARHRRKAKAHVVRVLAIFSVFVGLLAVAAVSSRDWSEFLQGVASRPGGFGQGNQASVAGSGNGQGESMRLVDPSTGFAQSRVGHMLFPSTSSDTCKRMTFDNRTGTSVEAGRVYCGLVPETQSDQIGQERAQQMLRAFRK
jgi:hypothetical protein